MTFQFDATRAGFEFDAHALADHAWSVAQRATIATLQAFYAEIETWPADAVGVAWEAYSSDIHASRWADMARAGDGWFLTYLYIRQLRPELDFWTITFNRKQFSAYAESKPWTVHAPLPRWANRDPVVPREEDVPLTQK
ncbi:hypothetical protein [Caballeronia sordidicola]|jgi:hypothetical protein|uniref:Uncharacterized protein n=1 Tax=Caballeronia sordidicola TaxID=196367 RepID=A0A242MPG0_CABSO|nr:hypothetical protein [Caballeronia sordidicola]OTP73206.1 hypothetical protein PAMC26577_18865 [Caballeronia sordidicola]